MNIFIVYFKSQSFSSYFKYSSDHLNEYSFFSFFVFRYAHWNISLIKYTLSMHAFWLRLVHWNARNWFTLGWPALELIHIRLHTSILHLPHEAHLL